MIIEDYEKFNQELDTPMETEEPEMSNQELTEPETEVTSDSPVETADTTPEQNLKSTKDEKQADAKPNQKQKYTDLEKARHSCYEKDMRIKTLKTTVSEKDKRIAELEELVKKYENNDKPTIDDMLDARDARRELANVKAERESVISKYNETELDARVNDCFGNNPEMLNGWNERVKPFVNEAYDILAEYPHVADLFGESTMLPVLIAKMMQWKSEGPELLHNNLLRLNQGRGVRAARYEEQLENELFGANALPQEQPKPVIKPAVKIESANHKSDYNDDLSEEDAFMKSCLKYC